MTWMREVAPMMAQIADGAIELADTRHVRGGEDLDDAGAVEGVARCLPA
jgi:hypothetical protein